MSGMRSQPDATVIFITIRICYRRKISLYIIARNNTNVNMYIYIYVYNDNIDNHSHNMCII